MTYTELLTAWRKRDNQYHTNEKRRGQLTRPEVEAIVAWRKSEAEDLPVEGRARALAAIAVEWSHRL